MVLLSKEHGLNPSITQCFFCGEDAGIVLTGLRGEKIARKMGHADGQMPMHCGVVSDVPCNKCEDYMKQGIIIIGTKDGADPNSDAGPFECRSGNFLVVKEEAIKRLLPPGELLDGVLKNRFMFMEHKALIDTGMLPTGDKDEQ